MAENFHPRALCETADFYATHVVQSPVTLNLICRNVDIYPFIEDGLTNREVPNMAYLITIGKGRYLRVDTTNESLMYAVTMAETVGPYMSVGIFPERDESRRLLIEYVKALVADQASLRLHSTASAASWAADLALHGAEENAVIMMPNLDQLGEPTAEDWADPEDAHAAMRVLYYISLKAIPERKVSGLGLIANVTVSVTKRGSVTQAFLAKVERGILEDLNIEMDLSADSIATFYKTYSTGITARTIPEVLRVWAQIIPQFAVRLSLCVQQVAGSGLTVYTTIGRAIKYYPDFPWAWVSRMFPTEWRDYGVALALVGGDMHYGFNKDLGNAKSTKYKTIGWIAKELIMRGRGERALGGYRGWPRTIGHQLAVSEQIDAYLERHREGVAPNILEAQFEEGQDHAAALLANARLMAVL